MAAMGTIFLAGPAPFSLSASSSPVVQPPIRGLSLVSLPPGGRWRRGSIATGIGSTGGAAVALPTVRWRSDGLPLAAACSLDGPPDGTAGSGGGGGGGRKKGGGSSGESFRSSSYAVPLGRSPSGITRPLAEILRDLNKRVPSNIVDPVERSIPWYQANRLLSFYAPGWCGEVRNVFFSGHGTVTVVYRVTIRGSDGEAHRESTGSVTSNFGQGEDPVAAAEEIAFCKACARFGLGLHLYHDDNDA